MKNLFKNLKNLKKFFKIDTKNIDYALLISVILLMVFGAVMVYSASYYNAEVNYGDKFYFFKKQIVGILLGIFALILTYKIDYHKYTKFSLYILAIGVLCLVLVLIPGVGTSINGATRWIGFFGITIQASEVAKFAFIIFSATYMAKYKDKMCTFTGFLPIVLAGGIMCLLILLEPNMSITICVGILMMIMLFVGGIRIKHFIMICIPILIIVPIIIIAEPYRVDRLIAFLDPWASPRDEGFQLIQSLYSLGAGGLFGVGLFNSRQKYLFLPFSESDFIFSIIGEEFGLVGAFLLMVVFAFIIYKGIKIALSALDRLGLYLSLGITAIIAVQVLINIAVVTGSIPPTGLPLPFISAGSSSLIVFMAGIGIILNINMQRKTLYNIKSVSIYNIKHL
ncbi:MAG: putative lipid II flippase FtsW [Clostridia bacterium]|jgi:cell division protein FtsW